MGYAERVFHIYVTGDSDEIPFRDYLRNNPSAAKEYESLKLSLMQKYNNNRDGYIEAKSDFIQRLTSLARRNDTD